MQGFRMSDCEWLLPPNKRARCQRATASDDKKRQEILSEFLYWLFDAFLMPLLRTTFYTTESSAFRNRVLYFRQDDWATISGPLLDKLKGTIFEPISKNEALAIMSNRKLGYSHIRLLPKDTGVRPIVNLRRRSMKRVGSRAGVEANARLGQSINYILQSAFHILTYEKNTRPDLLGSSVLGPNEVYQKLKNFKQELSNERFKGKKLYFVKVDVRCAFDTIDQEKLFEIIKAILQEVSDSSAFSRICRMISG